MRPIARHRYDAIREMANALGGVGSGQLGTKDNPWCWWGIAIAAGVSENKHPYSSINLDEEVAALFDLPNGTLTGCREDEARALLGVTYMEADEFLRLARERNPDKYPIRCDDLQVRVSFDDFVTEAGIVPRNE